MTSSVLKIYECEKGNGETIDTVCNADRLILTYMNGRIATLSSKSLQITHMILYSYCVIWVLIKDTEDFTGNIINMILWGKIC